MAVHLEQMEMADMKFNVLQVSCQSAVLQHKLTLTTLSLSQHSLSPDLLSHTNSHNTLALTLTLTRLTLALTLNTLASLSQHSLALTLTTLTFTLTLTTLALRFTGPAG